MSAELQSLAGAGSGSAAPRAPIAAVAGGPRLVAARTLERFGALYGASPAMRNLFAIVERVAPSSATALLLGESGTGKELVAARIHELSPRRGQPFVAVNCGALPESLIESELFGHERGSFTGAASRHRGCFERAHQGTLFLDEIAEMPADMQVRLLRVLETGRFTRVGGDEEIVADVRVIAATNRDLDEAVAQGRLRADLMYRLCVVPIAIPPLRGRDGDALLLAELFLDEFNREHGTGKRFTPGARERIVRHPWPGNVRELRNVVQRAFVLGGDEVDVDVGALPAADGARGRRDGAARGAEIGVPVGSTLEEAERLLILATLDAVAGSKLRAAQTLGISLKTLYNRLQAYRGVGAPAPARSEGRRLAAVA